MIYNDKYAIQKESDLGFARLDMFNGGPPAWLQVELDADRVAEPRDRDLRPRGSERHHERIQLRIDGPRSRSSAGGAATIGPRRQRTNGT